MCMCVGESDPVVKYPDGKLSADLLVSINCTNHTFKSYPGLAHSSSEAVRYNNNNTVEPLNNGHVGTSFVERLSALQRFKIY